MTELLVATTNPGKLREILHVLSGVPVRLIALADLPAVPEPEEHGATFAENARLKAEYYAEATGLCTVAEDSGLEIDALGGRPGVLSARYPGETYPEKFANLYRELAGHPRPWTARFVCSVAVVGRSGTGHQASGTGHQASGTGHQASGTGHQASGTGHQASGTGDQASGTGDQPANAQRPVPDLLQPVPNAQRPVPDLLQPVPNAQRPVPDLLRPVPDAQGPVPAFACEATIDGEIAPAPRGEHGFGYDPIFYYPPYGCTLGEVAGDRKLAVAHRGKAFRLVAQWLRDRPRDPGAGT